MDGAGAGGLTGARLGEGETVCAVCVGSASWIGVTEEVGASEVTVGVMIGLSLPEATITGARASSIFSLY